MENEKRFRELVGIWQDSGLWRKMSFDEFFDKVVEVAKLIAKN